MTRTIRDALRNLPALLLGIVAWLVVLAAIMSLHELKQHSRSVCAPFDRGKQGALPRPAELTIEMERVYLAAKRLNAVGARNHAPTLLEAAE